MHTEDEGLSPLGVYGQTKAAGDALVGQVPRHYVVRTSWVIGDGHNFVRTMANLAEKGASPSVVNDQFGRLTFTDDLARAIIHLLDTDAAHGTYNFTNPGPVVSWRDIAAQVFVHLGYDGDQVTGISGDTYAAGKTASPRPRHSALELEKLATIGFHAEPWPERLHQYLATLPGKA